MTASTFAIGEHDFLLDGKPFQILSGAMHYFRIHPDQWADRIRKARQMGLNTIETYVAWNAHAPRPGEFHLNGGLDLGRFLDLIAAEGMYAIVRPGPYICAEWANGGLPGWLTADPAVAIRRSDPAYLAAVTSYFRQLATIFVPRQIGHGGPIILVQVENEYGAYGSDQAYLQAVADLTRQIGITVPLTTVDQPAGTMLDNGSLPGVLMTGSFGSRVAERLAALRAHQPSGPLMVSEFWDGWFDDWGAPHRVTAPEDTAASLDEMLKQGASINLYMFHGGTNFGLTNGANHKGTHRPIVTSYDYDAPLDEAGNPTPKYWALRDVLARYAPVADDIPATAGPAPEFTAPLAQILPLWDAADHLGRWSRHDGLVSADALGQYQGFTLYRTRLAVAGPALLDIDEVRDRAQVFLDRQPVGVLARDHHDHCLPLPSDAHGVLELLVEDQGRVNYGPRIGEPKGLIGTARAGGRPLGPWDVLPLDLADLTPVLAALRSQPAGTTGPLVGPAFARATFDLAEVGDLFLGTAGWGKGIAWVNGFCLGRYWSRGPQRTLYVPGPVLRAGANELVILELHASEGRPATFVARPDLGPTEP